eukprot:245103_1
MTTPAVRDLNMALTRISSDLQFVSHRLEAHLREVSREGSKGGNLPDLAKLSKRISTLKTNIPLLEKHAENLAKSKAEVLEKLSTVSLENHNKMVAVYERLGFGADENWVKAASDVRDSMAHQDQFKPSLNLNQT